jgi:RNA polymerase sigma-70 factor (ECF subfamily)
MGNVPKSEGGKGGEEGRPAGGDSGQRGDDRELVRRAQAGDLAAFEELLRVHQRRVFAIVGGILRGREDIEDVAQQVFVKVFLSLRRFDRRSAFSTWLYKVTVNECWDYLRKRRARPLVYEADLSEEQVQHLDGHLHAETPSAPDAARRAELRNLLDRLMEALSPEEQAMLTWKEVEGFSVEEIGQMLGLNVNTVKVRLFRARARLTRLYRKRLAGRRESATGGSRERESGKAGDE